MKLWLAQSPRHSHHKQNKPRLKRRKGDIINYQCYVLKTPFCIMIRINIYAVFCFLQVDQSGRRGFGVSSSVAALGTGSSKLQTKSSKKQTGSHHSLTYTLNPRFIRQNLSFNYIGLHFFRIAQIKRKLVWCHETVVSTSGVSCSECYLFSTSRSSSPSSLDIMNIITRTCCLVNL